MPSSIQSYVRTAGGASFEIGSRQEKTDGSVGSEETAADGDSVDLSSTEEPSAGGGRAAYTPGVADRFRFDLQNGLFSSGRRFDAVSLRFQQESKATYTPRGTINEQVARTAGGGSASSALFHLQYQDASPDRTSAETHAAAIRELNRQRDQSLDLLRLLYTRGDRHIRQRPRAGYRDANDPDGIECACLRC